MSVVPIGMERDASVDEEDVVGFAGKVDEVELLGSVAAKAEFPVSPSGPELIDIFPKS